MKLPKLAIENHQFTMIIFVLLTALGLSSFLTMPRSEDPIVTPPGTNIIVIYPGATPKDMEELIVDKIEEELNELNDVKELKSEMTDGLAIIGIEFTIESDPNQKHSDVIQKVNSVRDALPDQIKSIEFVKWESSDVAIIQAALVSDNAEYAELQYEAERLESMWDKVKDVKSTKVAAFPEREIRISIDMERMKNLNIPLGNLIQTIQTQNSIIPGGSIDIGKKRFNIQTSGSFKNISDIENIVISSNNGNILRLKDAARVSFNYKDKQYIARTNGQRSVFITATQKENTNIYDVMEGLVNKIELFKEDLPDNMKFQIVVDQSNNVTNRLTGFFTNLLQGLILVGIIVLLFVGYRPALIVILAIPISILMGIFFLDLNGYGIQQISIAGLVIALGLLVDNAIVVTENIDRFMSKGYQPAEAAHKATSQIGWAVTSSTITTLLAFVPMLLIGDVTGDFIRSMPLVVIFTLVSSLLISLTLTPYLSSKLIKISKNKRKNPVRNFIDRFIETKYHRSLIYALSHTKLVIIISIVLLLLSFSLFPLVGVSFFPKSDRPQFMIEIELPSGSNLDETDKIAKEVEQVLLKHDQIRVFASNIGKGNPRVYYNSIVTRERAHYAQIFVELKMFDQKILENLVDEVRHEIQDAVGADIKVKMFEQGPPVDAPIAIRVIGENIGTLRNISLEVEKIISGTEGVINVNNPLRTTKADLKVNINRDKAAIYGVPIIEIDRTIRAAINGLSISEFTDAAGDKYDIVLRMPFDEKTSYEDFKKIYVSSLSGSQIPLSQLTKINFEASPLAINHFNLERNALITADVSGEYSVNEATQKILDKLRNLNLPKGYDYIAAGELETRQESFGDMTKAILISVLGIIAVLVLQFKSIRQPLIVFSAIPLAFIGSIIFLLMTGYSFSFLAFIGLTSLVGIVVNNSIILVDYANQLRNEGKSLTDAIVLASETRFIPIIVTTATTIGGLLPLTILGGTLWGPMGWTIIGGLLTSTLLTLIVVPVLYKLYSSKKGIS